MPSTGGESVSASSLRDFPGSADVGVHRSFMWSDDDEDESGVCFSGSHPMAPSLREELSKSSSPRLLPFQIESVVNTVYRPRRIEATRVIRKLRLNEDGELAMHTYKDSGVADLRSSEDDIGMTVTNDLFTGSGKTIASALGALVFARDRRDAVISKYDALVREQTHHYTRVSTGKKPVCVEPEYSDAVLIMCPKSLVGQWRRACEQAMSNLGISRDIVVNPRAGAMGETGGNKRVVIFDNALLLKRSGIRFVPCIIVDEFVTRNPSNILVRHMEDTPIHGRLVLVSADAGGVRRIVFGSSRKSLLRKTVGYDDGRGGNRFDIDNAMHRSKLMMSTAVLPTEERRGVKDMMARRMSEIPYEEYRVSYTPSLSASGCQIFMDRFGVDVESARSVGDIVGSIEERLEAVRPPDPRATELRSLGEKLRDFARDEDASCPVCMESFAQVSSRASVLNPCWHIFCDKCVTTILLESSGKKCPLCRSEVEGHTTAAARASCPSQEKGEKSDAGGREGLTFRERVEGSTHPSMGLEESCMSILRCIDADARGAKGGCYRVMMVVPDGRFLRRVSDRVVAEFEQGKVETVRFNAVGDKRKRVTTGSLESKIERFRSEKGAPLKILFTAEGRTDSLTGLDLPGVDCLVSVGSGSTVYRLGRLTRVSRFASGGGNPNRAVRCISLTPTA